MSALFSDLPEPFTASATATKNRKNLPTQPKARVSPGGGLLGKLLSPFAAEQENFSRQQDELEAKKENAKQLGLEYRRLKAGRDRAAEKLKRADGQFEHLKAEREDLVSRMTRAGWGDPAGSPVGPGVHVIARDFALSTFPAARKLLADKLAAEDAKLSEFCERNGVPAEED